MALNTADEEYTKKLIGTKDAWYRKLVPLHLPYQWNLRRLKPGFLLQIGCGIGRSLEFVKGHAVGVDHNASSVAEAKRRGYIAYTTQEFPNSKHAQPGTFDSLLLSNILEHMHVPQAIELIRLYLPYLKPHARVIVITPQEWGHSLDSTHVEFMDFEKIHAVFAATGLALEQEYSFPFPRAMGPHFIYNEFVAVGRKT